MKYESYKKEDSNRGSTSHPLHSIHDSKDNNKKGDYVYTWVDSKKIDWYLRKSKLDYLRRRTTNEYV
jgi:hypothetical protein